MDNLLWERVIVTVVLVFFTNEISNAAAANATYSALYAFGDSILDTGNNNYILTITKSNFAPYGRDFPGGIATGRWCNGKVPTDLIAGAFGIKETVPASMSPNLTVEDLATGVSFASAGSGTDDLTARLQGVLTISAQLDGFTSYIQKLNEIPSIGPQKAASIISNGLYLLSSGNNDIALNVFRRGMPFGNYSDSLVELTSNFLKNIYQKGARHVWVLSTLPLGCLPGSRTVDGGFFRQCSERLNTKAQTFNAKLEAMISALKNHPNFPNFDVRFIDVYNPMLQLIQNPSSGGFSNAAYGCCGDRIIDTAALCEVLPPCQNTSEYFFFDAAHPSEKAYKLTVDAILKANNFSAASTWH